MDRGGTLQERKVEDSTRFVPNSLRNGHLWACFGVVRLDFVWKRGIFGPIVSFHVCQHQALQRRGKRGHWHHDQINRYLRRRCIQGASHVSTIGVWPGRRKFWVSIRPRTDAIIVPPFFWPCLSLARDWALHLVPPLAKLAPKIEFFHQHPEKDSPIQTIFFEIITKSNEISSEERIEMILIYLLEIYLYFYLWISDNIFRICFWPEELFEGGFWQISGSDCFRLTADYFRKMRKGVFYEVWLYLRVEAIKRGPADWEEESDWGGGREGVVRSAE